MNYEREALEKDDNPIAMVILAAQERERLRRGGERFNVKWYLIRKLYERGHSREEVSGLFEFIDWVIQLNDAEENLFWENVKTLEEENKMPYVTVGERIGMRKGLEQGLQQGLQMSVLETLEERFGEVPTPVSDAIHQIENQNRLRTLLRQAIRSASLKEFQQALNGTTQP